MAPLSAIRATALRAPDEVAMRAEHERDGVAGPRRTAGRATPRPPTQAVDVARARARAGPRTRGRG